jgi:hypothetical protein
MGHPLPRLFRFLGAAFALAAALCGVPAKAAILLFNTELLSMNLTGGPVGLPLATDPTNALGDSISGYGFVNSTVRITLSSTRPPGSFDGPGPRSLGQVTATNEFAQAFGVGAPQPIDPNALDRQEFVVQSFFDVFFDITVTDVDDRQGRDYAGMGPGATILLPDIGPANMANQYIAIFDKDAPNFGLIPPPESAPYIGHFNIEIPLGGDINGNGEIDKIKFTFASHTVGAQNRTFITLPDGTVIDSFDSAANLEGAVVDVTSDPPFTIGLTGPTTASSRLLNPTAPVPEPSTLAILSLLGISTVVGRWFRIFLTS